MLSDIENMVEPSAQPAVYGNSQQGMAPFSNQAYKIYVSTAIVTFHVTIIAKLF